MSDAQRDEFDRCWPWLKEAVARAGDTHRKRHVWARIADGRAQFWPLPNGAMVTEIVTYDTGFKDLRGWLAGGDLREITAAIPAVEAWAKRQGCSRAIIHGRKGWARALPDYEQAAIILAKEL